MSRLVVVSNRVAIPGKRGGSQGGLASGLLGAMQKHGGLWFGWNGKTSEQTAVEPEVAEEAGVTYATVPLTSRQFEGYYVGAANSLLWPLFHSRLNLIRYNGLEGEIYQKVNLMFARQLLPMLRPDDLVWVHDYHLLPLGRRLREAGVTQPIGFFLHVPFPFPDVLRAMPGHRELLESMLHYDVIGFQTSMDVEAFSSCVEHFCPDAQVHGSRIEYHGRSALVRSFPIGIDVDAIADMASKGRQGIHGRRLEESLTKRRLIIGVDRLDYSKGLPERLLAYGQLLESSPEFRRKVVMLQIAPLSRTEVAEYEDIRQELNSIAGDIHGRFAEYDWLPLRYMTRGFQPTTVMGFLSLAQIGLVTPLRDGMNLVAKEYIASQPESDPGVLVLSSLAGAAEQLRDAIIVNPYDVEGVAAGIAQGLRMPVEERRERWRRMMGVLRNSDIHHWVGDFIDTLSEAGRPFERREAGRRAGDDRPAAS
ncbi:MAG TPA: trehalose-6-phosphate synthase [Gammaproteobacteria bacterium]